MEFLAANYLELPYKYHVQTESTPETYKVAGRLTATIIRRGVGHMLEQPQQRPSRLHTDMCSLGSVGEWLIPPDCKSGAFTAT